MTEPEPRSTSALYWFPRLRAALDLQSQWLPRSFFVPYDHRQLIEQIEGAEATTALPREALAVAARMLGYPVFVRTDLASAKHEGPHAYQAIEPEDLWTVAIRTAEDNEIKLWPYLQPRAFMLREWLSLHEGFRAFGGLVEPRIGHKIGIEFRVFAHEGKHDCTHFYWPEDAIQSPDRENWQAILRAMAAINAHERQRLEVAACQASLILEGAWSIDFALDVRGHWWLIDCALAEESWHPPHEEEP